ncbi:hypothetical protein ES707_20478 [subsurface metagenome]
MHYLKSVIVDIDRSHSRLGKAVAFTMIAAKARKAIIIVSPAGMGKSTTSNALATHHPEVIVIDAISEAGLSAKQDLFTDYNGVVVIDDLGKLGSHYRRLHTLIAMSELVYSHYQKSYMWGNPIDITNFTGSAILNVQPAILGSLIASDEWEVVLMDKTIRYYHLYRPIHPNPQPPELDLKWGIDVDLVKTPTSRGKMWRDLTKIGQVQWSDARVVEHIIDLLRATAALDSRKEVENQDYSLLVDLMKPLTIERYLIDKFSFESGRNFKNNMLAIMIEVASWNKLTVYRVARDYKLTPRRAGELITSFGGGALTADMFSGVIKPTEDLKRVLREAGA